ncbi:MAG: GspE/PulE family protein [Deltaproteobacteria bacterium]|nr:GspE/PulE family protein [Deltaproteobacteria bacterium]
MKKTLEQQLEYQKKLNSITNRIHSARDTDDILLNLQDDILLLFDADRITIYAIDGIKKQLISRIKTGNEIKKIHLSINNRSIAGYCATTGRLLNINDVHDEVKLKGINPQLKFDSSWDKKTGYNTNQVLVAPISCNKYLLGVMQLINKKSGGFFDKEDESSIQAIAKTLGIAFFKNQKTTRELRSTKFGSLVLNNIITANDLKDAMSLARRTDRPVESVLINDLHIPKERVGKSSADYYKTRFIPYDQKMSIPDELLKGLKPGYLRSNLFIPVARSGNKIVVAMEAPASLSARDAVKKLFPATQFEYCVSFEEDIHKMIDMFLNKKATGSLVETGSIEDILGQLNTGREDYEEEIEVITEEDSAIVQLVNKIIIDAYNRGASDIHIEPRQGNKNAVIRIRIDGACQVYQTIPFSYQKALISRIKIMSDLDIAERRLPQDGKIKFKKFAPLDIELRVATIPTAGRNEDVVMRILAAGEPISLDKMGMSERNLNLFKETITKPYGIVLVVGPTGSGKTTTLHAALAYINKPETKIWTAEDPVEITQDGLRQVQINSKIGFNFATAMRAFLRADPDVIMVGEMRDKETVSTGIEASLTGHLVFSTLHTNSAPETITRLLDMGMDPFNFADALLGVLAQRLVRTLCKECREKYHPTKNEFDVLARTYNGNFDSLGIEYNNDFFLYKARGCPQCNNTGYRGRTGIHELLAGTDEMKSLIQNRAKIKELKTQGIKDGMTTLMQDGIRKVCLGLTEFTQVRKVCIK